MDYNIGSLGILQYGSSLGLQLEILFPDYLGCKSAPKQPNQNQIELTTIVQNAECSLSTKAQFAAESGVKILLVMSEKQKIVSEGTHKNIQPS